MKSNRSREIGGVSSPDNGTRPGGAAGLMSRPAGPGRSVVSRLVPPACGLCCLAPGSEPPPVPPASQVRAAEEVQGAAGGGRPQQLELLRKRHVRRLVQKHYRQLDTRAGSGG